MQFKNTPQRYGVVSAALHWLTAPVVYGMFALGLWMVTLSYYDGWYHVHRKYIKVLAYY